MTDEDGLGGGGSETGGGASDGEDEGSSGGSVGDGGAPTGGRASTGGSNSITGGDEGSGGSTGGASTGGAPGTGGAATGGASTGGSSSGPCDVPTLVVGQGSGDDINNVCGWTDGTAPTGYVKSRTTALDCDALPTGMVRELATFGGGIWRSTYVSVIDPADRCETGTMDGADRIYSFTGDYCMRISSPFSGLTVNGLASAACVIGTTAGSREVGLAQQGWVRVDVAAKSSGTCPLSCD